MTTYDDAIKALGESLIKEIEKRYREQNHIATGEALESWHIEGDELVSESEGAYYLETGRHPKRRPPPIDEIIKWCVAKGISVSSAYAIRLKIARDGIPPTHIIRDMCEEFGLEYEYTDK